METINAKNVKKMSKKGISLITLILTIIVALILLSVILISLKNNSPTNKADEAVFRNDFVVLQNELTSSKLNEKINNFEASEDINISMNDNEIYNWLPSLKESPLKGKVEICQGEVIFVIEDTESDEYAWAQTIAGAEKVCETSCADAPKVFSPEITANVESGQMATSAVFLTVSGGVSDETLEYYYEYSIDKGNNFEKITEGDGKTLTFDGVFLRQIVQVRTVATIDDKQYVSKVSEYEVYINKTGVIPPIISATNGYVSSTWTASDVTLIITSANENLDELLQYCIAVGNGEFSDWVNYREGALDLTFTQDGEYRVKARSINDDKIGAESSEFVVKINKTLPQAPTITASVNGKNINSNEWTNAKPVRLSFFSGDNISKYEYSLDNGATWIEGNEVYITTEGITNCIARAYNMVGAVGSVSNAFILKIDQEKPVATLSAVATTNSIKASVVANDGNGSGVDTYIYYLDGKMVGTSKSSEFTFSNLTQSTSYTVAVMVVDSAGNSSNLISRVINTIAIPIPTISLDNRNWTNKNVTATIVSNNQSYTTQYQVVSKNQMPVESDWRDYSLPITISQNSDVYARLLDNSGQSGQNALVSVNNIDKNAPNTAAPTAESTTRSITVTFNQEDTPQTDEYGSSGLNLDRTQYSIKKGDLWSEYQYNNVFDNLTHNTEYAVRTRAVDNAGNYSLSSEFKISTKKLELGKINFNLENANNDEYIVGSLTNQNVKVSIQASDKQSTIIYSKDGSAQYVAKTSEDVIIQTEGITTIVAQTTDGVNTVTQEYTIMIDKTAPAVTAIEVTSPESGKYSEGTKVTIKVGFTENINVVAEPILKIKFGESTEKLAKYVESSNNEMLYEYVIEHDDNGILTLVDFLEGQILDAVGNVGHGQITTLTGNTIIAANRFSVTIVSSPMNAGTVSGSTSAIYSDDVTISATPGSGYVFKKWTASSDKVSIQNELSPTTSFKMPAENVTLTANFGFIEYTIKYDSNSGTGTAFESLHTYDKKQALAKNTYIKEGYVFAGWSTDPDATVPEFYDEEQVLNLTNVDGDVITLYAVWQVGISQYKVEHYIENKNSTAYILYEEENLTAPTDTEVSATNKDYVGFYFNEMSDDNVTSGIVTGDGSLTLKFYYTRNTYTLQIDPNGGMYGLTTDISTITGKYESAVTIANPTKQGYIFNGWIVTGYGNVNGKQFIFDASDATITATWKPGTSNYNIEYYQENIESTGYDLFETVTLAGTTDSIVDATLKDYVGFSVNEYIEGTTLTGTITPDNSLVLKVYYVRNTYNLTVNPNGGEYKNVNTNVIIPGKYETIEKLDNPVPPQGYKITYNANGGTSDKEEDYTVNVFSSWEKTGVGNLDSDKNEFQYLDGNATLKAIYNNDGITLTNATRQGYDFLGWYLDNKKVGNATDKYVATTPQTLTAMWSPREDTLYKVEHYKENVTKDGYELFETEELYGITDTQIEAISKIYEGFTFDNTVENTVQSGNILPDGSLVLKLYYTRNVHNLSLSISPKNSGTVTQAQQYVYGQKVNIEAIPNEGYLFSNWYVSTANATLDNELSKATSFVMPDSDVSITATFIGISYTIKYDANSGTGTMYSTQHTYDEPSKLSKNTFSKAGYNFIGWNTDKNSNSTQFLDEQEVVNLSSTNGEVITLYAIWSADKTSYKSEHYFEQLDGTYKLDTNIDLLQGTVDSTVYAQIRDVEGFYYDTTNENNVASGVVNASSTLTLKSYYNRNSYTLIIDPATGTYNSSESNFSITGKYEQVITLQTPLKTGYTFNGFITEEKGSISGNNYTFAASDEKITATYRKNKYNVTYNYMGATANNDTLQKQVEFDSEYGTLPNPIKEYEVTYDLNLGEAQLTDLNTKATYQFSGWFTENTYINPIYSTNKVAIPNDHTLYAKYVGGDVTLPSPTRQGYIFGGWYISEENNNGTGTKAGDALAQYVPNENITLYAGWIPATDTPYKVNHYLENVTATGFDLYESKDYKGTTNATVTATENTYEGYTLDKNNPNSLITSTISADGTLILKLYYTRNSYDLTINPNGGTFADTNQNTVITKKHGQTQIIEDPTIPKAITIGYELYGGSATLVEANTTAIYTFTSWTKTGIGNFDTNSKEFTFGLGNASLVANYSKSSITLPEASKTGYILEGYYEDADFKNKIGNPGDTYIPESSTTIYARWIEKTDVEYKVYHYLENAEATGYELQQNDIEVGYGATNSSVSATPKAYEGFTFNDSIAGTVQQGNILPDGSLILKLYYTRNLYSLTIDPNGGEWNSYTSLYVVNKKHGQSLFIVDPSVPSNTIVSYELDGGNATLTEQNTQSTYNFLNWTKIGVGTFDDTTKYFTFGIGTTTLIANYEKSPVILPNVEKQGFTFYGWYTDENLENKAGDALEEYVPEDDIVLYPYYVANTDTIYKVKHYLENVESTGYDLYETQTLTGTTDEQVSATSKTYTGFTFDSSNVNNKTQGIVAADNSLELELYYSRNDYKLTVNPNGGTFRDSLENTVITKKYQATENIEYPQPPSPFTVSYDTNGGIAQITSDNTTANKIFSSYTTKGAGILNSDFVFTFGAGDTTITANYKNGSIKLPTPTKEGYTFNGWYTEDMKTLVGLAGASYTPVDDITLYAKWTANKVNYNVEHYVQNLDEVSYTLKDTQKLTGYTDSQVTAVAKNYEGFTYDESNENNIISSIVKADGTLTLKLYYTRNSYSLSLTTSPADAGSVSGSGTYKYEQTVSISATINNGYLFEGWTSGDSIQITDESSESTTFIMPAKDTNITANYNVIAYKINYILNDGVQNPNNPTSYTVTTDDIQLEAPTKEGYVFRGWSQPSDSTAYTDIVISKGSIGDRTYIANWQYATVEAYDMNGIGSNFDSVQGTFDIGENGGDIVIYANDMGYVFSLENVASSATISISSSMDQDYTEILNVNEPGSTYTTTGAGYVKISGDLTVSGKIYLTDGNAAYISDKLPRYNLTAYLNDGTESIYEIISYRKMDAMYLPDTLPTRAGYTFKGWSEDKNSLPSESYPTTGQIGYITSDKIYYAIWAKATTYTVEHYRENVNKTGYELYEKEIIESITGNTVTANAKDYSASGFTYDSNISGTITSGEVLSDGSLTLKLYYQRGSYDLTIDPNGGVYDENTAYTIINRPLGTTINIPVPTRDGYTFTGWSKTGAGTITTTTPIATTTQSYTFGVGEATLTANWKAIEVSYTIEHYKQNLDYSFTLVDKETKYAVTQTTVTATSKSYTGFEYSPDFQGSITSGIVKGDGSLTLKLYYTRKQLKLTIKPNGGSYNDDGSEQSYTGMYGSTFIVDGTIDPPEGYKVTYVADGGTPSKSTEISTKSFNNFTLAGGGTFDSETNEYTFGISNGNLTINYKDNPVELPTVDYTGYYLEGWYLEPEFTNKIGTYSDEYTPTQNVTLYAKKLPNSSTEYKVYHYLENVDGSYPTTPSSTNTLYGTTDEVVQATPNTYSEYTYDSTITGTVASGTVAADGSLILKLYYKRNYYTLTLTSSPSAGGTVQTSGEYKYGSTVTIKATPNSGYSFSGWSTTTSSVSIVSTSSATTTFVMPAKDVNITGSFMTNSYTLTVNPGNEKYTQNYLTTKSVTAPKSYYTVTYDSNGGTAFSNTLAERGFSNWSLSGKGSISSTTANPTTYTYGAGNATLTANYNTNAATITLPTPTKLGYTFDGWYDAETDNNGSGTLIGTAGANYTPNSDKTLYAKWTINSYSLTVNPGNEKYTQNYGTTKSVNAPTSYYTVKYDVNGGNAINDTNSQRSFSSWSLSGAGSISSTTANPTTYTFGAGQATLTANYSSNGTTYTLPTARRAGYTFNGWYSTETNNNGSGTLIGAAGANYTPTKDTTLYAKWTINTYTLTVKNGSTTLATYTGNINNTKTIELSPKYTIKFNTNGGSAVSDMTSNRTVASWALSGAGSISSTTANPTVYTFGEGNATLTATYSTTGSAINLPATSKTGYTFNNWCTDQSLQNSAGAANASYTPTGSSDIINLYAKFTKNKYTVSTSSSPNAAGTTSGAGSYEYQSQVSVTATANQGYAFEGWYNGTTKVSSDATYTFTLGASNVSLVAKFTAGSASYKVNHYVMNTSGAYPTTATSTQTLTGTTDKTLTLSELKNSSLLVTNGIIYSHGQVGGTTVTTTTILGNNSRVINLYYKRTYGYLTTATGSNVTAVTEQNKVKYYYGATVPSLTATLATETGYQFAFTNFSSSNTTYLANKSTNPTGTFTWPAMPEATSITYTANASKTPKVFTISLNNQSATSAGSTAVYEKYATGIYKESTCTTAMTTSSNAITTPTRTGYTFGGYYTSTAGGGTQIINASGYITSSFTNKTFTSNTTLYAKWTANSVNYKVEHYLMNTSGAYPTTATSTQTLSGLADSSLTLANLKYTTSAYNVTNGIVYSHGTVDGNTVTTTTVLANGTRVIKLYYERYYGTLTTAKGNYISDVTTQSAVKYYYGATVPTLSATISTATGYVTTFSKWSSSNTTYMSDKTTNPTGTFTWPAMPKGTAITLTANATRTAGTVSYKVEHYLMNTSGAYPTTATSTQTLSGTTGATLTLSNLKYTTSTYNVANGIIYSHGTVGGSTVTTTTVLADSSRVIKLYYKRTYGYLTTATGSNVTAVTTQNKVKYYYGATVPSLTATLATATGYTISFTGWNTSNSTYLSAKSSNPTGTFTWPAMPEATSITLTANASKTIKSYTLTINPGGSTATQNYATTKQVSAPTVTVTYNYNGNGSSNTTANPTFKSWTLSGTGSLSSTTTSPTTYTYGAGNATLTANYNAVTLPSPTRTGYTFNGWYTAASGGTKVGAGGASYTPTANTTLYAQWKVNSYTLTINPGNSTANQNYGTTRQVSAPTITITYNYNGNGSSNTTVNPTFKSWTLSGKGSLSSTTTSPTTYTYGAGNATLTANYNAVTLPSPTRTGYTFNGWYTAASGGSKIGAGGASYTATTNTTLYAQWTINKSKLTINPNGGSVSVTSPTGGTAATITSSKTYEQNYNTTLTYGKPTKATSTVTNATYTVTYNYNGNGSSNTTATATKKTTTTYTFSSWTKSTTFYGTLSSTTASGTYKFPANSGVTSTITANYSSSASTTTSSVTLPTPTRTGYTFAGWYTAASGGTKVGAAGASYTPTASITLYAQWTINKSKLTINPNGGSVSVTSPTGGTAATIKSSKTYEQNYNTTLTYGKPTKATSTVTNATYTVTYNYNGNGSSNTTATATKKTTTTYTFSSWTKSTTFYGTLSSTTASGTYKFPANSGVTSTITANYSSSASTATSSVKLPTPTRTGYTFAGWYTAASGGTKVGAGGASYTPTASITLYAHWTAINYTLTLSKAGSGSGTLTGGGTKTYGQSCTATATASSGSKFIGWYESLSTSSVTTRKSSSSSYTFSMPAKNYTLYGLFQNSSVTVVGAQNRGLYTINSSAGTITVSGNNVYVKIPGAYYRLTITSGSGSMSISSTIDGTYTSISSGYITPGARYLNISGTGVTCTISYYDGTPCSIGTSYPTVELSSHNGNHEKAYKGNSRTDTEKLYYVSTSGRDTTIFTKGGIETIIYVPANGYTFKSTNSGTTVSYSSTRTGTYTSVGSVANSSYTTNKGAGYYKFYGSQMTINIYGPGSTFVNLNNKLPIVYLYKNYFQGSPTHVGNKVNTGTGCLVLSVTTTSTLTLSSNPSGCGVSRSSSLTGTYTVQKTWNSGVTTGTYTFNQNYYYKFAGSASSRAYIKDSTGSAVQFSVKQ